MGSKAKGSAKYADNINKSQEQINIDALETNIAEAKNNLEMGILDVKGQLITAESQVKRVKSAIASAEKKMDAVKYAVPFNVNNILAARKEVLEARASLEEAQEKYDQINSAMNFLVDMNKELF
jgi:chromosome segregation ATPase